MSSITDKQIDSILPFLDRFESPGFSVGTWDQSPGQIPSFNFSVPVSEFIKALYDNGWIKSFDWPSWQEEAKEYVETPSIIEAANAETIQKLFTTHVRKDRFCEGHLAEMFNNGHIVALLRRLNVLRGAEMSKSIEELIYDALVALVHLGEKKSFVVIEEPASKKFVQFGKGRKLGMDVPFVALTNEESERAYAFFQKLGEQGPREYDAPDPKRDIIRHGATFYHDFGADAQTATKAALSFFNEVYHLPQGTKLSINEC